LKARTVPQVNTWVNGRGCQRPCTYLPNAAVAERPVSSRSGRPGRSGGLLTTDFALTSRTAGYGTRTSGGVGGALSDGRPYPYNKSNSIKYISTFPSFVRVHNILSPLGDHCGLANSAP